MKEIEPLKRTPDSYDYGANVDKTSEYKAARSISVLYEAADLQLAKSQDYQSEYSTISQADYYPRGIDTIQDVIHAKKLRADSIIAKSRAGMDTNFESLQDTYRDLINYCTFAISYIEGEMDGQNQNRDMFNRVVTDAKNKTDT